MASSPPRGSTPGPVAGGAGTGRFEGGHAFLLIWGGQTLSLVGTSMTRFALLVWGWEQTGQATTLSLLVFFQVAATVLVSPLAGVVVDQLDRRTVMILSDLGSGIVTLALVGLYLGGDLEVAHLYLAAAVSGAFETFQFPAYSAAVTLLLPGRHYARASGLISLAESGSRILGPPLAGVLLPLVGFLPVLAIDLATFAVAVTALLLARIPAPQGSDEEDAGEDGGRPGLLHQMGFGFRYIARRPGLLGLQLLLAAGNFLLVFGIVLRAPLILARTGGDEVVLGQVMGVAGAGGALGGLLLVLWGGPKRRIHGVLAGWMVSAAGNVVLGLGRTVWVWAAGAFLYPFFLTLTNGLNQAIWQSKVAPTLQGRVFATRRLVAQLSLLPAMIVAGPMVDRWLSPALEEGGALADLLGPVLGTGPGAGSGLLVAATGLAAIVVTGAGWTLRPVRRVEDDLPDHRQVGAG